MLTASLLYWQYSSTHAPETRRHNGTYQHSLHLATMYGYQPTLRLLASNSYLVCELLSNAQPPSVAKWHVCIWVVGLQY